MIQLLLIIPVRISYYNSLERYTRMLRITETELFTRYAPCPGDPLRCAHVHVHVHVPACVSCACVCIGLLRAQDDFLKFFWTWCERNEKRAFLDAANRSKFVAVHSSSSKKHALSGTRTPTIRAHAHVRGRVRVRVRVRAPACSRRACTRTVE